MKKPRYTIPRAFFFPPFWEIPAFAGMVRGGRKPAFPKIKGAAGNFNAPRRKRGDKESKGLKFPPQIYAEIAAAAPDKIRRRH